MRGCQKKKMMQHDDGWMMVQPSLPLASSQVGDWSPALLGERRGFCSTSGYKVLLALWV